mmetsp:Transcript_86725/g.165696  ORF Transcript_86725/g.165696 Transcript_86725/m.165696 type:complete len:1239 (-) Transcript_86725:149-3865(-)
MATKMLNGTKVDSPMGNRLEQKSMSPQADLLQATWEKPQEFLDPKALEHYQLQCNLAREQMTNCVREMVAIRQDVNSLRLADSQHEMQQCEITRHLREMQASIQQELTSVAAQRLSVDKRFDLLSQAQERALQDNQHLQDQLSKVAQVVEAERRDRVAIEERCNKAVADLKSEMRFVMDAEREELQKLRSDMERESERRAAGVEELSLEIQAVAKTVTAEGQERSQAVEASLREVLPQASEEVRQELKESAAQLEKSFEAALGLLRAGVADEAANRKSELARLSDSIERLEAQPAAFQSRVDMLEQKVQTNLADLDTQHKCRYAELTDRAEKVADRADKVAEKQAAELQAIQDDFRSQLARMDKVSEKNSDYHAEFRNHLSKVASQESEARKDQHASFQASLESVDSRLRALISDVKTGMDKHRGTVQDQLDRQRQAIAEQFEQTHGSIADHLEDVDRRLKSSVSQLSSVQGTQQTSLGGLIREVERKLRDELADNAMEFKEFQGRHAELKDMVSKEKLLREKQSDSIDSLETRIRRDLADHRSQLEQQNDSFREQLSRDRMAVDSKHDSIVSRIDDLDRRLKDPVQVPVMQSPVDPGLDRDAAHSMLTNLERKLRDEYSGHTNEHRSRHQDLKEQLAQLSGDHSATMSKVNDVLARLTTQERTMRDEHHSFATVSVNSLEQRLRRELGDHQDSLSSQHTALRETIAQEQRAREKHHGTINSRFEEVEWNLREAHAAELRKVREETSSEHSNRFAELKDLIGKMCAQEAAAREDIRSSFMAALEALGMKYRREVEDSKAYAEKQSLLLREQVSKERQEREAHLLSMSTSVGALERRVREELEHKLEDQRNNVLELKDGISKSLSVDKVEREELRAALEASLEALEVRIRQELGSSFGGELSIREHIAQERRLWEKAIGVLTEQLSLVEQQLVAELRQGACAWEACESELRILLSDTTAKDRSRVQELFSREQELRASLQEGLQTQLAQEKTAREDLHEKTQAIVAQERNVRDSLQEALKERIDGLERASSLVLQDCVPRSEFESVVRRICEVVDSHSYNLAVRHPAETRLQWMKPATGPSSPKTEVSSGLPLKTLYETQSSLYESQSYAAPPAAMERNRDRGPDTIDDVAVASTSQVRRGQTAVVDIPASVTYAAATETISYPQELSQLSWPMASEHSVSVKSIQQGTPATSYISADQIDQLATGAARCSGTSPSELNYHSGVHERGSKLAFYSQGAG